VTICKFAVVHGIGVPSLSKHVRHQHPPLPGEKTIRESISKMELLIICLTAFLTAILTFFSGFGLGTILSPVFMLFFPPGLSIALTGIVHFFNNLFKLFLTARNADKPVLIRFGVPAVAAAFIGSFILLQIQDLPELFSYSIGNKIITVFPLPFTVGLLMFLFVLADVFPITEKLAGARKNLVLGGALSGFFGGLSGHQGALRSAFLVKAGLSKERFIGTAVVVSTFVDMTRLGIYFSGFRDFQVSDYMHVLVPATLSAISGAYIGNKLLKKVTIGFIQVCVTILLMAVSLALTFGLI